MITKRLILTGWVALSALAHAAQTTYISSDFTGTTATDWTLVTGAGDGPSLTAGSGIDPEGSGWMRLTADKYNQSSFIYYNDAIPTVAGLQFTFDFVIYGEGSRRADGLALVIFDSTVTPAAGAYGGSLGYAQRTGIEGLAGGIAGFGFDTFGNFSDDNEGKIGGPGQIPNSIAIRGSMGVDRTQGYEYITGTNTLDAFSTQTINREEATIHTVRITIPTNHLISIDWKIEGAADWTSLIDEFECDLECPENIKFGFTAGTGSYKSNQEIRNLSVTSIPESSTAMLFAICGCLASFVRIRKHAVTIENPTTAKVVDN